MINGIAIDSNSLCDRPVGHPCIDYNFETKSDKQIF